MLFVRAHSGRSGAHLLHEVQDLVREGRVGERESLGVRLGLREQPHQSELGEEGPERQQGLGEGSAPFLSVCVVVCELTRRSRLGARREGERNQATARCARPRRRRTLRQLSRTGLYGGCGLSTQFQLPPARPRSAHAAYPRFLLSLAFVLLLWRPPHPAGSPHAARDCEFGNPTGALVRHQGAAREPFRCDALCRRLRLARLTCFAARLTSSPLSSSFSDDRL